MAKNQVFKPQRTRVLPVPDGTVSGAAVVVGSLIGVCLTTEGTGGNADNFATVALDGAFKLAIATTTTGTVGAPVYITSGNAVTMTPTSNTLLGYLLEAKGSTAGQVCTVELAQV
jgi:predicted RecA/RadA family phage recombinase